MSYWSDGMRQSAQEHLTCADMSSSVARMLAAIDVPASIFGAVPAANAFAATALGARDAQARGADAESARRTDLEGRATSAAFIGDVLTADTTETAASASPPDGPPLLTDPPGPR